MLYVGNPFIWVFGPERGFEATDAVYEQRQGTGEPHVVRERIASRTIAEVRLGQRDAARFLEAALR